MRYMTVPPVTVVRGGRTEVGGGGVIWSDGVLELDVERTRRKASRNKERSLRLRSIPQGSLSLLVALTLKESQRLSIDPKGTPRSSVFAFVVLTDRVTTLSLN